MEQRLVRRVLRTEGMTCTGCETRIENVLKKLDGVVDVKAIYSSSNVYVTYNANVINLDEIIHAIEKLDYTVVGTTVHGRYPGEASNDGISSGKLLGIGIVLLAIYTIVRYTVGFDFIPEIDQSMGYGILFLAGLLTSLHCIAMCGGINLSQCVYYDAGRADKLSQFRPGLLYNSGRVISYTVIGGTAGAIGSAVKFPGALRGIVAVIAGMLMVVMGLNMLDIFPWLRKITPRMPKIFGKNLHNSSGRYGPFFAGLLNGLMPCGQLQAMQIYALGTGNFAAGALSMLIFGLGTVPLMLGFSAVSLILGGKFRYKMLKAGAVLVILLGVVMANRGLALSGISLPSLMPGAGSSVNGSGTATVRDGIQTVVTKLQPGPGRYEPITVQKGIPVKWIIKARKGDINGCNNEIVIPVFNISRKLEEGDNIIEFTPEQTGTFVYSCWMGMIRSRITVVDDISSIDASGSSVNVPGPG